MVESITSRYWFLAGKTCIRNRLEAVNIGFAMEIYKDCYVALEKLNHRMNDTYGMASVEDRDDKL